MNQEKGKKKEVRRKNKPWGVWEARYTQTRRRLARTGYIVKGSVTQTRVRCGNQKCPCHRDKKSLHGPYVFWTTKVGGKTVTRSLSAEEARLYTAWVKNRQRLEALVEELLAISRRVALEKLNAKEPFIPGA